jgi:hypothetical protein
LWYGIPQRNSYDIELKTHKHILKSGFFPVCFLSAERQALGPLVNFFHYVHGEKKNCNKRIFFFVIHSRALA